jgi:hypothetical protein
MNRLLGAFTLTVRKVSSLATFAVSLAQAVSKSIIKASIKREKRFNESALLSI